MPKRDAIKKRSRMSMGSAPAWSPDKRLEYHLTEAAMHLAMCETIIDVEPEDELLSKGPSRKVFMMWRHEAGRAVKKMYRVLEINCPDVIKQSHTWKD